MGLRVPPGEYFGTPRAIGKGGTAEIALVVSEYQPGDVVPAHQHEQGHFCYVLEGAYRERVEGRHQQREACDLLWHPAGATHAELHGVAGRHLLCEPSVEGLCLPQDPRRVPPIDACALGAQLLREVALGCEDQLAITSLVYELVAALTEPDTPSPPPTWLHRVEECIRDGYRASSLGLEELAAVAGVSGAHLARVWRKHHGRTVGESVRRLRIAWAQRVMARSLARGDRVRWTDIALEAGFADLPHFSRTFRVLTGCSPSFYMTATAL